MSKLMTILAASASLLWYTLTSCTPPPRQNYGGSSGGSSYQGCVSNDDCKAPRQCIDNHCVSSSENGSVPNDTNGGNERCNGKDDDGDGIVDNVPPRDTPCGYNNRGTQKEACENGTYVAVGSCTDPDECKNDSRQEGRACGINLRGQQDQTCVSGKWEYQPCADPDECRDGERSQQSCNIGRGLETIICRTGQWRVSGSCSSDAQCDEGNTLDPPVRCGYNRRGIQLVTCIDGRWVDGQCDDPDECVNNNHQEGDPCGLKGEFRYAQLCREGSWENESCPDPDVCVFDGFCTRIIYTGERWVQNGQPATGLALLNPDDAGSHRIIATLDELAAALGAEIYAVDNPVWSPDNRTLAFLVIYDEPAVDLVTLNLETGQFHSLFGRGVQGALRSLYWPREGDSVLVNQYIVGQRDTIHAVSTQDEEPQLEPILERESSDHLLPPVLLGSPDFVIYTTKEAPDTYKIKFFDRPNNLHRETVTEPTFIEDVDRSERGQLAYITNGNLLTITLIGTERTILVDGTVSRNLNWLNDRTLLYQQGDNLMFKDLGGIAPEIFFREITDRGNSFCSSR